MWFLCRSMRTQLQSKWVSSVCEKHDTRFFVKFEKLNSLLTFLRFLISKHTVTKHIFSINLFRSIWVHFLPNDLEFCRKIIASVVISYTKGNAKVWSLARKLSHYKVSWALELSTVVSCCCKFRSGSDPGPGRVSATTGVNVKPGHLRNISIDLIADCKPASKQIP